MAKKRNKPSRKDPAFCKLVVEITKDATATLEELTAKMKPEDTVNEDDKGRVEITPEHRPDGVTIVESLMGHYVFDDVRLDRHIDTIQRLAQEFKPEFWEEGGRSILEMRRDYKNRVWGRDEAISYLCYLLIAVGAAKWTHTREHWKNFKDGVPHIQFLGPKREELFKKGESNEQH